MVGFLFGGNTGETAGSLKRKRETIEALQKQIMGSTPKNTAEGIAALMKGVGAGIGKYRLDKTEREGAADFTANTFNPLIEGSSPFVPAAMGNSMPKVDDSGNVAVASLPAVDLSGDKESFVSALLPAAMEEATRTGVDPRIIVAQAAQETGWGKSAPGNNFFGIKSHGKGGGQNLTTHEVIDGQRVKVNDSFRQFASPADSVRGYGDFLLENPRYEKMRTAQGLDAQLQALGASGYATDPNYSSSVGAIARGIKLPGEVASLDPSVGMTPMPVDRGAMLADPPQIRPEDAARLASLRGDTGGNTPYTGPGAKIDTPMPVYDEQGLRMPSNQPQTAAAAIEAISPTQQPGSLSDEVAAFQATPEYASQFPGRDAAPTQARADSPFVPAEFRNSPQITAATGGIVPALMGGTPATQEQVAQSAQVAQQQPLPQQSDIPQAQARNALGVDPRLIRALSSPFIAPEQRAVLQTLADQQMQEAAQARQLEMKRSDPAYRLDLEKSQLELNALRNPQPGYRMLTADERKVYGIPEYDTRPYQISKEGQVTAVGGMGQAQSAGVEASQREALAARYGIDPKSAEGQRFILTGTLPASDRGVTAGDREAIRDGDDQVQAAASAIDQLQSVITPNEQGVSLNDRAGSGATADWQSWAARNDPTGFFDDAKGEATTELNNTVLGQALGSLKSIFGAAPTEGERQILLDMQASVDKTPAERRIIIEKAVKLAQRRLAFNQDRVNELRGGTYYKTDRGASEADPAPANGQAAKRLKFNPQTGELE